MRVFVLGWGFPPFISGGLGTACYGLTKAMSGIGTHVMFVLPRSVDPYPSLSVSYGVINAAVRRINRKINLFFRFVKISNDL